MSVIGVRNQGNSVLLYAELKMGGTRDLVLAIVEQERNSAVPTRE
jgi:hypothetical protein